MLYEKWKKILDEINYIYTENDYILQEQYILNNGVSYKSNSALGLSFYKERYTLLDYTKIYELNKSKILSKRINNYDPIQVSKKYNISIEDAIIKVDNTKKLTSGSLDNYIRKYGVVEGNIKYVEFCKKCVVTEDSLIIKHGIELGKSKWLNYCSTRDSGSLEYFIKKYNGDIVVANQEYSKLCDKVGSSGTHKYFTEKYGKKRADEISFAKGYKDTEEYYIDTFGYEEGMKLYNAKVEKKRINLAKMIEKYGEIEGKKKYLEWKEKIYRNNPSGNNVSKTSLDFFSKLESVLDRKLQYGSKKEELKITLDNRMFFYDCYDEKTNTIIEFNGSRFHPSPELTDDEKSKWLVGGFSSGLNYEDAMNRDLLKNECAIANGFNLIIVWDYQIKTKYKLKNILLDIETKINENFKNN